MSGKLSCSSPSRSEELHHHQLMLTKHKYSFGKLFCSSLSGSEEPNPQQLMLNKTIKSFLVFSVSIFSLVFQNCLYTSFMHRFSAPDRNLYRNQGIYLQYNTLGNIHMNIQNIFGASIPSLTFFKQFLLYIFSLYRFRKKTKLFEIFFGP